MIPEPGRDLLTEVRDGFHSLLPRGVAVAVWGVDTHEVALLGRETQAISRAVESRREEFARGRACARSALKSLGIGPVPLGVGEGNQPLWPRGFVGSITHGAGIVAAAAARIDTISAVGIDVELLEPLPGSVRKMVVNPGDSLKFTHEIEKVVFSGKESVFKALYPACGVWMDFDAVSLTSGPETQSLQVRPTGRSPVPHEVKELVGGYRILARRVLTAFWKPGPGMKDA